MQDSSQYVRMSFGAGTCIELHPGNPICKRLNTKYGRLCSNFSMPDSLTRDDVPEIFSRYLASGKTDGHRFLLVITSIYEFRKHDVIAIIGRDGAWKLIELNCPKSFYKGTVIDGEVVVSKSDPLTFYFVAFDVYMDRGDNLMQTPLHARLSNLFEVSTVLGKCTNHLVKSRPLLAEEEEEEEEEGQREKKDNAESAAAESSDSPKRLDPPFRVVHKHFAPVGKLRTLVQDALPACDYACDGLIFSPLHDIPQLGRSSNMFKLKPRAAMTVDFVAFYLGQHHPLQPVGSMPASEEIPEVHGMLAELYGVRQSEFVPVALFVSRHKGRGSGYRLHRHAYGIQLTSSSLVRSCKSLTLEEELERRRYIAGGTNNAALGSLKPGARGAPADNVHGRVVECSIRECPNGSHLYIVESFRNKKYPNTLTTVMKTHRNIEENIQPEELYLSRQSFR